MSARYDALLVVSFGGPEAMDEVAPFLDNVLRGRAVPPERLRAVVDHYRHFGGRSPINEQCRVLLAALRDELERHGPPLALYWGNRNWRPLLPDTLRRMQAEGVRHALAFVTSAFGSYSGCRQYLEDIARARAAVGPGAPEIDKLRGFHNHPGFVEPLVESVRAAFARIAAPRQAVARLVFSAHSIPLAMAASAPYEAQLRETAALVAAGAERPDWELAFQSRSGPPGQPWLEPELLDRLRTLAARGVKDVVLAPIGFVSDHMEVVYDLDVEAKGVAAELGLEVVRAATVGTHPRFVRMVRELALERISAGSARPALGSLGPPPDRCPEECCRTPGVRGGPP
jgi:ferrochelatase